MPHAAVRHPYLEVPVAGMDLARRSCSHLFARRHR